MSTFRDLVAAYENTAVHNDALHAECTRRTDTLPYLRHHRDIVESRGWGTGDRAFHYHWYLLLQELCVRNPRPELLEIGVFKGQVISLWALIAKELKLDLQITAVSPFEGNLDLSLQARLVTAIRKRLSSSYRKRMAAIMTCGNTYPKADYLAIVREVFTTFDLSFDSIRTLKGRSADPDVLARVRERSYGLIYVDGDHTYEGALSDLDLYGPLVEPGGFLVMDDAACDLPGSGFWKGYPTVTRACARLPELGFTNVLNVGHNRVYEKRP